MRLIDADALGVGEANRDVFIVPEYADGWNSAIKMIKNAPTIDAEPVRHGHWNSNNDCSLCGMPAPTDDRIDFINILELNYCPYCGAKMDGGE